MPAAILEFSSPILAIILLLSAYRQKNYSIRMSCLAAAAIYFLSGMLADWPQGYNLYFTFYILMDSALAAMIWTLRGPAIAVALLGVYMCVGFACIVWPYGWAYTQYELIILSLDAVFVTSLGLWPLLAKRDRRRFDHLPYDRTAFR
jgi:hypothetical protein